MADEPLSHANAEFDAWVFDLDGVLTDTASVHAAAWKELFDAFLAEHAQETGGDWVPFDSATDYREYVDGKPRYDGVRSFLKSRGITLPDGEPTDPAGAATICGLGNTKNEAFRRIIGERGVDVYDSSVAFVRRLRDRGVRMAVASSSKNCRRILDAARIRDLFEAVVDGTDLEARNLPGKPDPAMFLEAARELGIDVARTAVVEDAIAGVEAGRRGGFGLVVGVDRTGDAEALRAAGADVVVADLAELDTTPVPDLPSALAHTDAIAGRLAGKTAAVFLDYDGTLTPIVAHPDLAILSEDMRTAVGRLARVTPVAIISGRDVIDVRDKVGVDGLHYAGSHGFDIVDPKGGRTDYAPAGKFLDSLDAAECELDELIGAIPGAHVERKRFAIAAHFRQVADDRVGEVQAAVDTVGARHRNLRTTTGKMILELRPKLDWHKGRAVLSLLETLGLDRGDVVPIYIGDDITDEDAFRALRGRRLGAGIGIVVEGSDHASAADYRLTGTDEVGAFLAWLAARSHSG